VNFTCKWWLWKSRLQRVEEEGEKCVEYEIEAREHDDDYATNLHVTWDLIYNSKALSGTKMTLHSKVQKPKC